MTTHAWDYPVRMVGADETKLTVFFDENPDEVEVQYRDEDECHAVVSIDGTIHHYTF